MPVYANIGGTQKQLSAIYANVGGAQKQLSSLLANVGGVSKELMAQQSNFWTVPHYTNGTMATNSRTRMVADSVTVVSDGTFTLVSPTSISGRPGAGKYYVSIGISANNSNTTGTTLYYALNANGAYRGYNVRDWKTQSSNPSTSSSSYGNVDAVYNGANLLVNKTKISSFYRWTMSDLGYSENISYGGVYDTGYYYGGAYVDTNFSISFDRQYIINNSPMSPYIEYSDMGSGQVGLWVLCSMGAQNSKGKVKFSSIGKPGQYYQISYTEKRDIVDTQGSPTGNYKFAIASNAHPTNGSGGDYWYSNRATVT